MGLRENSGEAPEGNTVAGLSSTARSSVFLLSPKQMSVASSHPLFAEQMPDRLTYKKAHRGLGHQELGGRKRTFSLAASWGLFGSECAGCGRYHSACFVLALWPQGQNKSSFWSNVTIERNADIKTRYWKIKALPGWIFTDSLALSNFEDFAFNPSTAGHVQKEIAPENVNKCLLLS